MKKIVLFASGSGSNVENIYSYFKDSQSVEVVCVFVNNPKAFVLERASKLGLESMVFSRDDFYTETKVLDRLKSINPDLIVLAGFLWLIPENMIEAFGGRMINVHPALLPNYGGKGMYGMNVHRSVVKNKESKSGITIHHVNEHFDEGEIIFQAECEVLPNDTAEDVAQKIHALEFEHFPKVIEEYLG